MQTVYDPASVRVRLAETIAWCRLRALLHNPAESLRTPALRPSNLHLTPNKWGDFDYDWGSIEEKQAVVANLATRRAELLRAECAYTSSLSSDLAGGRLLIAVPEESDTCGLSEFETDGFIDALDVPAWDTWTCYLHESTTPDLEQEQRRLDVYRGSYKWENYCASWNYRTSWNLEKQKILTDRQTPTFVSYILCWIPPQFIEMVEMGILVNPVQCISWAADYKQQHYNTPLLRYLDAEGLLQ